MCDYCDCRSIPEIGELSDEHMHVLALTRSLAHDTDGVKIDAHLRELQTILLPHTAREERGVFAVLAEVDVDASYRQHFLDDHEAIDELLDAAISDHSEVPVLVARLERHVFEEETDLYPAIRQLFSPADWHEVDHRLGRAHSHVGAGAVSAA